MDRQKRDVHPVGTFDRADHSELAAEILRCWSSRPQRRPHPRRKSRRIPLAQRQGDLVIERAKMDL